MKRYIVFFIITIYIATANSNSVSAQTAPAQAELSPAEIEEYKERVKQLISFLEFALNTVGNKQTTNREKDIIINQSFLKFFKDDKVQIEDDLYESRDVVTNKDVQAYLKDIDFFFHEAEFEFEIEDISHQTNDENGFYFLVATNRRLKGVTLEYDTINVNKVRYIEVNLDDRARDLKIASIYTTKLSEDEELRTWWSELSFEWRNIFKRELNLQSTASLSQLKKAVSLERLDISGNQYITSLEPLSRLTKLRELNISNTKIDDLVPLRNLNKLEVLACSESYVRTLEPLRYATSLKEIICNSSQLDNLSPLQNFAKLERLSAHHNSITSLEPLMGLKQLKDINLAFTHISDIEELAEANMLVSLDISGTNVSTITPLSGLEKLQQLNIENTAIKSVEALTELASLQILYANNTAISSIDPLSGIDKLERVYCDNTQVSQASAQEFMIKNPSVLVVYETKALEEWFADLTPSWQDKLTESIEFKGQPGKEELARIANLSELDLSNNSFVQNLKPLVVFRNLRKLNINNTSVSSLAPLKSQLNLEHLEFASTNVATLEDIEGLRYLKILNYDNTEVPAKDTESFISENNNTLVIYKTAELNAWWSELSEQWKKHFTEQAAVSANPSKEQLHEIAFLEKLTIEDNNELDDLEPLRVFVKLEELRIVNSQIRDLEPLAKFENLQVLQLSRSPVSDLEPLAALNLLRVLDIENTPVSDLSPLKGLIRLEELKCAGTQIRNIRPLSSLYDLRFLDTSNTSIKTLKHVKNLDLETLLCYNTRISNRKVNRFKQQNPDTKVVYY